MSSTKDAVSRQGVACGAMISELFSANLPRLYQVAGLDFAIVDCEHGHFGDEQLAAMAASSQAYGFDLFVRTAHPHHDAPRYLDLGVRGVVQPRATSAASVRDVAQSLRYPPSGHRGVSVTRAHADYTVPDLADYLRRANASTMLLVQIETVEAADSVEAIAALPGVDGILLGPGDLSVELGRPGDLDEPRIQELVRELPRVAGRHGILSGAISSDLAFLERCRDAGMSLLSWGSEVSLVLRAAKNGLESLRRPAPRPGGTWGENP